jgi:hypothetical protein
MPFSVRQEYSTKTPGELMTAPVDALLGVDISAAKVLISLGINEVGDLARSELFRTAEDITDGVFTPKVPHDRLSSGGALIPIADLPAADIGNLRILSDSTKTETFRKALGVATIREMAWWPPYRAAKDIDRTVTTSVRGVDENDSPPELVPSSGRYPVERVQYDVLVLDEVSTPEASGSEAHTHVPPGDGHVQDTLLDLARAGALDLTASVAKIAVRPAEGALLTWTQSWYTEGLGLGQLLHSLALAPGESTRIAMIDWTRRQSAGVREQIVEGEQLLNDLARSRSINEVTNAVATEAQEGFSRSINKVEAGQVGFGSGGSIAGSYEGINFAAGHGLSASYAQGTADVQSRSWTTGRREVSAALAQNIVDRTHQASSLARSRWATIVKEVSQQESERVSTRAVTNYTHMHALTVQYWEVVQLYRVAVELTQVDAALFIPMKPLNFGGDEVQRYRFQIAAAGLNAEVRALAAAEPGWVAISSPNLVGGNWKDRYLDDWKQALNQPVATASDSTVVLPQGITRDFGFGYWTDGLPIESAIIYWRDGTNTAVALQDRAEGHSAWSARFAATVGDTFNKDKGGRDYSEVRRIAFRKKRDKIEASAMGDFVLTFSTTLADRVDAPALALAATLRIPGQAEEFTAFEFDTPFAMSRILQHLNANRDHYSRAIWSRLDAPTIFGLLRPYLWRGKPVISQVDPLPIGTAGNYLVFRRHPAQTEAEAAEWRSYLDARDIRVGEKKETLVPMPSGGVFAEAVLGRANSAEKLDITRFWNWQDSPIPIPAPEIAAIQSGSRAQPDDTKPGVTPAPILNIMNAPSLPDPSGMAAVLSAVQNGAMFRDMSGLAATIGAAQAALGRGFDASTAAGVQAGENFKTAANLLASYLGAKGIGRGGGGASADESDGSNRSTADLPATPSNLGALMNKGREMDQRGLLAKTDPESEWAPYPGSGADSAPSPPPLVSAGNEQAAFYGTRPKASTGERKPTPVQSRLERVVQFFVLHEDSSIVVPGDYQFEVEDAYSAVGTSFAFSVGSGRRIGATRLSIPAGVWNIAGYVRVRLPNNVVRIPVKVLPGLDPVTFNAERTLLGPESVYEVADQITVEENAKVVSLFLRPTIHEIKVEREIQLSASATGTAQYNAEVKAEIEAKGTVGVAEVGASGGTALSAGYSLSGTLGASQTLKLTMVFKVMKELKFDPHKP